MNNTLKNLIAWLFFSCFSLTAITPAVGQNALVLDAQLEQQLDDMLRQNFDNAQRLEAIQTIVADMAPNTPIASRVRALSYLAIEHAYVEQYDQAAQQLEQLQRLVAQYGVIDSVAEVKAVAIEIKLIEGKTTEAFSLIADAELALAQTTSPRIRYYSHALIASVYRSRNQFEQALTHLLAASEAIMSTNDSRTTIRRLHVMLQIASLQSQLQNHAAAIKHVEEVLRESNQADLDDLFYNDAMLQKALIQTNAGNYEQALATYQQLKVSVASRTDSNSSWYLSTVLNNMGDLDIRTGRFDDARKVLTEARELARANSDEESVKLTEFNIAFVDVHEGLHQQGIERMAQLVDYFSELWPEAELEALLGEYAEALGIAGNFQRQAEILLRQRELRETLFNRELQKNLSELQTVYESKDKEQQIKLLQQQNHLKEQLLTNEKQQHTIMALMIALAVLAIIIVFFLYRAARHANKQLKHANAKLADQSLRDPLTGLLNRRALQLQLTKPRLSESNDAMILLDIDQFKRINDHNGHQAGDQVLIEIAKRLRKVSRDRDQIIRWGGEEFLIYVVGTTNSALPALVERVLHEIARAPIVLQDRELQVTATAGFISFPFNSLDGDNIGWEETLQLADLALYAGKVHGRNQGWGVMRLNIPFSQARQRLESDLPGAIEDQLIDVITVHGPHQ